LSSVLVVQTHDQIYIGADSAVSTNINNNTYRLQNEKGKKLHIIEDMVIFCSGNMALSEKIIDTFKSSNEKSINSLKLITSKLCKHHDIVSSIPIDIIVARIEENQSVVYQISPYNSFEIGSKKVEIDDIGIWTGGLKTEKAFDTAVTNIQTGNNIFDTFKNSFNKISCEAIGGELTVYKVSKRSINKVLIYNIQEPKSLKTISISNEQKHFIVGERVYGKIISGVNLTIENESGMFTFDQNGLRILGTALTIEGGLNESHLEDGLLDGFVEQDKDYTNGIRMDSVNGIIVTKKDGSNNELARTVMNATQGITIQKKELGSWVDKFYVDTDGNLTAEDLIARKLIIRDSGGITLINADTKTIDFTGFNVITGKEDVLKGVVVKNASNETTFNVTPEGLVTVSGSIQMLAGSVIDWNTIVSPAYDQIQGIKPPADADNTSTVVGDKLTQITSTGVYTGDLTATQIKTGTLDAAQVTVVNLSASSIKSGKFSGFDLFIEDDCYLDDAVYLRGLKDGFANLFFGSTAIGSRTYFYRTSAETNSPLFLYNAWGVEIRNQGSNGYVYIQHEDWKRCSLAHAPLLNGWKNFNNHNTVTTFHDASFMKDPFGIVHLRGMLCEGGSGQNMFQLPTSYRPLRQKTFIVASSATGGVVRIDVFPDGFVKHFTAGASTTYVSLEGIMFDTDDNV
jgi:hypothetical protein